MMIQMLQSDLIIKILLLLMLYQLFCHGKKNQESLPLWLNNASIQTNLYLSLAVVFSKFHIIVLWNLNTYQLLMDVKKVDQLWKSNKQ